MGTISLISLVFGLIPNGCQPDQTLHEAAGSGNLKSVASHLKWGASVDSLEGGNGVTPLSMSAPNGHLEVVRFLLKKGADIDYQTEAGYTALHNSVLDESMVQLLIQSGADVNVFGGPNLITPLHLAAGVNQFKVVDLLIAAGGRIDVRSLEGFTPLDFAMKNHLQPMVAFLKGKGASGSGSRSVYTAVMVSDIEALEEHMDSSIDIEVRRKGKSLLEMAVEAEHYEVVRILLGKGANPESRTRKEEPVIFLAVYRGNLEITRLLLNSGANKEVLNQMGQSPLDIAVSWYQDSTLADLIRGFDPVTKN
ncbi:MAG TPA: ankyrin repeat domain-containing protein [Verrucomicrobiales bacterium]|nr:ankyrin repeat domain-containing protein [Verrucomicrobiales bacterium]